MTTRILNTLDRTPWSWLTLWTVLIAVVELRWGLGVLAWLLPLPALRYLRITEGWKSRALLVVAAFAGWTLAFAKITTDQIPMALAPLFSLPITFFRVGESEGSNVPLGPGQRGRVHLRRLARRKLRSADVWAARDAADALPGSVQGL